MSYARSPRPSLVMTVGIRAIFLTPCGVEADAGFRSWWRVDHGEVSAEVGDAAQRVQRKRGGREPELDGRIFRPTAQVRVGAQEAGEVGVDVGGPGAERVSDCEQSLGGDLLAAALHL